MSVPPKFNKYYIKGITENILDQDISPSLYLFFIASEYFIKKMLFQKKSLPSKKDHVEKS